MPYINQINLYPLRSLLKYNCCYKGIIIRYLIKDILHVILFNQKTLLMLKLIIFLIDPIKCFVFTKMPKRKVYLNKDIKSIICKNKKATL